MVGDPVTSLADVRSRLVAVAATMGVPIADGERDGAAVAAALDAIESTWTASTHRLEKMLDALHAFASLEFQNRLPVVGDGTLSDAAAATINMLAEEMNAALGERTREVSAQKALVEAVVNSMGEGVIVRDVEGRTVLANPAAKRILGRDWDGVSAPVGLFHADRRAPFPHQDLPMTRALRGQSTDDVDLFVRNAGRPDGVELSITGRPVVDGEGNCRGGLIVFRDVTDRNRADAAIRRLAAVVAASNDAVVSYGTDGTITTWNGGAEQLYACSAREVIGSNFERFVPPEGRVEWRSLVLRVGLGERIAGFEAVRLRHDGTRVVISMSAAPIVNAAGFVTGVSAISRDVTEAKRLAQELADAKERAEAGARAKSQFLANMSHEIRTPLTAVLGFTDLLIDPYLGASDRLNYLMTIRRNGEHLLSVINDVLDLSKIEAGAITLETIECSPSEILNDVAATMSVRAAEKGIDFEVRFDTPIPARIHTDPTRLRQVLLNLVGNAVKFTKQGGVRLVAHLEASTLLVDVIDTGIGLSQTQLDDVFRPFRQADPSMTRRFGGTGLGLAICLPLATALGGTIHVQTAEARGSTFTLRLPVEIDADTEMTSSPSDGRGSTHPATGAAFEDTHIGGRVLLAEDGIDNQILVSSILRKRGIDVRIAENGRIAIELALAARNAAVPFDVILMDMQMPELDGYGATARLRAAGYRAPIVALTAHALSGERERCLAAGCDDYLKKPIDRGVLLRTVRRYVHGSVGLRELHSSLADDVEMRDVIERFVSRTHATADSLRNALIAADLETLRRTAHQLKGAGGGYGFGALTDVAALVESALGAGGLDPARALVEELIATCASLRATKEGA